MSWRVIVSGQTGSNRRGNIISFEIQGEPLLLKLSAWPGRHVKTLAIVDLVSKTVERELHERVIFLYKTPKRGKYSALVEGLQLNYEISIFDLDASNLPAPLVKFVNPLKLKYKVPTGEFIRQNFFLREEGQDEFVAKPLAQIKRLDPNRIYEVKYEIEVEHFKGLKTQQSPVTKITPDMNVANSFAYRDYLDLGNYLSVNFIFSTAKLGRFYLEVNLDGKNWITFANSHQSAYRPNCGTFFGWQLPNDIFDTLTLDTVIDWRLKYQSDINPSYVVYSYAKCSLIRRRKNGPTKELMQILPIMVQMSKSDTEMDAEGYDIGGNNWTNWNLYLFSTGKFLYVKSTSSPTTVSEFHRTGNFIIHESKDNNGYQKLTLYPKIHNQRPIKQLKFDEISVTHPLFSVNDLSRLLFAQYFTEEDLSTFAMICRYFYDTLRSQYAIEGRLNIHPCSHGHVITAVVPAWHGTQFWYNLQFIPPMFR